MCVNIYLYMFVYVFSYFCSIFFLIFNIWVFYTFSSSYSLVIISTVMLKRKGHNSHPSFIHKSKKFYLWFIISFTIKKMLLYADSNFFKSWSFPHFLWVCYSIKFLISSRFSSFLKHLFIFFTFKISILYITMSTFPPLLVIFFILLFCVALKLFLPDKNIVNKLIVGYNLV